MAREYMTQDEFVEKNVVDQTVLITDLSHQLEEARKKIEVLEGANREWHLTAVRLEGAKEALKELLSEFIRN
jgi:hypothetical protein